MVIEKIQIATYNMIIQLPSKLHGLPNLSGFCKKTGRGVLVTLLTQWSRQPTAHNPAYNLRLFIFNYGQIGNIISEGQTHLVMVLPGIAVWQAVWLIPCQGGQRIDKVEPNLPQEAHARSCRFDQASENPERSRSGSMAPCSMRFRCSS
jgi:hypothetical protein